jgi:hypothetical protein
VREIYEFRIQGKFASLLFSDDEGVSLGPLRTRKILISPEDSRFSRIGELDQEIHRDFGTYFFAGWNIHRRYSRSELLAADALTLWPKCTFEPCGELCGTTFDQSVACVHCGAGAAQTSDLRLDLRKAPKDKDIARTIAGEIVVSQKLAEGLVDAGIKGVELRRCRHKARYEDDPLELSEAPSGRQLLLKAQEEGIKHTEWEFWVWLNRPENSALSDQAHAEYSAYKRRSARTKGKPPPVWYQVVVSSTVDVASPTRTGVNPFDDDNTGEHRCPRGDTIGLNLLSELFVSRGDFEKSKADILETRQYIGVRRGVLRPERRLLISQRFRQVLEESGAKGFSLEVTHLV